MDIAVIGGGIAGVSAALYASSRGKNVVLFEKDEIGGLIRNVSSVSHFPAVDEGESGANFAAKLAAQLSYSGIEVRNEEVLTLEKADGTFRLTASGGKYEAKAVIGATGSSLKEIESLPCRTYHWPFVMEKELEEKTVVISGGSDGAAKEALYISRFAAFVHIVQDAPSLLCIDDFKKRLLASPNIRIHTESELERVEMTNGKCTKAYIGRESISADEILLFVQIGQVGSGKLFQRLATTENDYIKEETESKTPGLFFAGDVRVKKVRQLATAAADGCLAGILAASYCDKA